MTLEKRIADIKQRMAIWFCSKEVVTFGNPEIGPEGSASQVSERSRKLGSRKGSSSAVSKMSRISYFAEARGKSQGCSQEGSFVSRGIHNVRKGNP